MKDPNFIIDTLAIWIEKKEEQYKNNNLDIDNLGSVNGKNYQMMKLKESLNG